VLINVLTLIESNVTKIFILGPKPFSLGLMDANSSYTSIFSSAPWDVKLPRDRQAGEG